MKRNCSKLILVLLLLLLMLLLAGCSASSASDDTLEEALQQSEIIDVDLSGLSGTVVYAQVYDMLSAPEQYIGKQVQVSGYYDRFADASTGLVYESCVIPDALACCAQGLEFVWADPPEESELPEMGEMIRVTGRFETYLENEILFVHLVQAQVVRESEDSI